MGKSSTRTRIFGRIEGDRCVIPISQGNLNQKHVYLRTVLPFFPSDSIGGSDGSQPAERSLTLSFERVGVVTTDIAGEDIHKRSGRSKHFIFRVRSATWRSFFEAFGAKAGDEVVISRDAPYAYSIALRKVAPV